MIPRSERFVPAGSVRSRNSSRWRREPACCLAADRPRRCAHERFDGTPRRGAASARSPAAGALALAAFRASAQGLPSATLTGHVTQAAQGLPGVTVTARSPNLQGSRSATTTLNGDYVFNSLPPGEYTITFELSGFQTRHALRAARGVPEGRRRRGDEPRRRHHRGGRRRDGRDDLDEHAGRDDVRQRHPQQAPDRADASLGRDPHARRQPERARTAP